MGWLYLAAGVVAGGLLMFLIAKRIYKSRNDDPVGSLVVEYENLNELPYIYLALEVDPDVLVKKSRAIVKIQKHKSHK